jgi:hypothetical protein
VDELDDGQCFRIAAKIVHMRENGRQWIESAFWHLNELISDQVNELVDHLKYGDLRLHNMRRQLEVTMLALDSVMSIWWSNAAAKDGTVVDGS